ncbi:MAG: hypothetical protein FJ318_07505 [SAR202 cluster bacterium]|nr:hypothetical protein [SAR202 cluster bacterium]
MARALPASEREAALFAALSEAALVIGGWRTAGARPANHPRRRMRGAAELLARHAPMGLAASLRDAMASPRLLVEALTVTDLDGGPTLVGVARARELATSVALPHASAMALVAGDRESRALAERRFRDMPALEENTITREARRLLGRSA